MVDYMATLAPQTVLTARLSHGRHRPYVASEAKIYVTWIISRFE